VEQLRSAILDRARNSPVRNFAREDYRKDTKWIWLGRYFKPHKEEASKAAAFIVPAARPFLFADSDGGSASDGPTDRIALSKRRLKQARFRDDIARGLALLFHFTIASVLWPNAGFEKSAVDFTVQ
jgi:hypothetical protein